MTFFFSIAIGVLLWGGTLCKETMKLRSDNQMHEAHGPRIDTWIPTANDSLIYIEKRNQIILLQSLLVYKKVL